MRPLAARVVLRQLQAQRGGVVVRRLDVDLQRGEGGGEVGVGQIALRRRVGLVQRALVAALGEHRVGLRERRVDRQQGGAFGAPPLGVDGEQFVERGGVGDAIEGWMVMRELRDPVGQRACRLLARGRKREQARVDLGLRFGGAGGGVRGLIGGRLGGTHGGARAVDGAGQRRLDGGNALSLPQRAALIARARHGHVDAGEFGLRVLKLGGRLRVARGRRRQFDIEPRELDGARFLPR